LGHIEFCLEASVLAALRVVTAALQRSGPFVTQEARGDLAAAIVAAGGNLIKEVKGDARYVRAASARGIPWAQAVAQPSVLVLGQGFRKRRVWRNFSDRTGHIATVISTDKIATNRILRDCGLPVPRQIPVEKVENAVTAFRHLGAPVVVKPHNQDFGTAVFPHLDTEAEVRTAFVAAAKFGTVIVEQHIAGDHHRMMVLNGRFVSARRQIPAHIVGDATSTVAEILARTNGERLQKGWSPIPTDPEAEQLLSKQGLGWTAIPAAGRVVFFRRQGNLSTGGSMDDVTERVHPENRAMAVRAAEVLGIDIAGVDFITPDISVSFLDGSGAICEVNVTPGFIFDENRLLLADWFPCESTGRIPVAVVIGDAGDFHLSTCLAAALGEHCGGPTALALSGNVSLGGLRIADTARDELAAPERIALYGTDAHGAVLALDGKAWTNRGVELDRIDLLVVRSVPDAKPGPAEQIACRIAETVVASDALIGDRHGKPAAPIDAGESGKDQNAARQDPVVCPVCGGPIAPLDRALLQQAIAALPPAVSPKPHAEEAHVKFPYSRPGEGKAI
jgi:D-alanine-D-alanine ligase-like ATP-grasp enzyme